jgi:hypothetical protein
MQLRFSGERRVCLYCCTASSFTRKETASSAISLHMSFAAVNLYHSKFIRAIFITRMLLHPLECQATLLIRYFLLRLWRRRRET